MIFDQYSRYKACTELLIQSGCNSDHSVLDVGSGPECLLETFMPGNNLTFVDPLIETDGGQNRIKGDIHTEQLTGRRFDYLTAIDVLEHIPADQRLTFLERLSDICQKVMILGFPTSDSMDAIETDKEIDAKYNHIYGKDYPWLKEHYIYGLPNLVETVNLLKNAGWSCQTIGHGHAPWYRELLGFSVCVWEDPNLKNVIEEVSEKFNTELYCYDFNPPHYRQFIVASSSPAAPIEPPNHKVIDQRAQRQFRKMVRSAHDSYFVESLKQLNKNNNLIVDLNKKIQTVSTWGNSQNDIISKRDIQIRELNKNMGMVSSWGNSLEKGIQTRNKIISDLKKKLYEQNLNNDPNRNEIAVRDARIENLEQQLNEKHRELMKMSDWASSMVQDIKRLQSSRRERARNLILGGARRLKPILKNRYTLMLLNLWRRKQQMRKKTENLEDLRRSIRENNGKIIITFPVITWDFRWQRPQQIVTRLRNSGYAVLYLAMTLFPIKKRYGDIREAGDDVQFNLLDTHIHQIWLHSKNELNIYSDPLEGDDLYNVVAGLRYTLQDVEISDVIYLIQFPGWGKVAIELKKQFGGKIIFDCMDDHGGFSTNSTSVLKVERLITEIADLVITSSDLLEEKARKINPCTIQIKNGTEFEHFSNPEPNNELDHLIGNPIVGYHGAISDWFDTEIIEYCATQKPHWNFVLIGSTVGADINIINAMENVHLLGEKPYDALPGYLAYFDVCTIPFKIIPLTLATNPVKFYEYLSAGKPVVSTALPEILQCKENCYIANTKEEFLHKLESALNEINDIDKRCQRIQCAQNNSWDARVESILANECFI